MTEFLKDSVIYRRFVEDSDDGGAVYEEFGLTNLLVREVFAVEPEMTESGVTTVYFFPGKSGCADENGNVCGMPCPKAGDLAVLHRGTENERTLRVAEAGYFTSDSGLGHVRLKLR